MTATAATTDAEIRALITADHCHVEYGAHLLDADDIATEDISADISAITVERQNYADVHGTISLDISRALTWTSVRVRPYQRLTGAGLTATWPLGVFLLTTPVTPLGETPITYSVAGYDKMHLLQKSVGDTYVVASGTGYLAAVRAAITASGVTGLAPLLDGTAGATVLPAPMVWWLDAAAITWISVINDLLAAVGYAGLWANAAGRFCSAPYQNPKVRAPVWTLDISDPRTNIVLPARTFTQDKFDATNWWRFVRKDMSARPTEGTGFYTVDKSGSSGGRKIKQVISLDAASQATLVSRGDAIVQEARQREGVLVVSTGPLPVLWHFDCLQYKDPASYGESKVRVRSWRMPLDGKSDVELTLEVV